MAHAQFRHHQVSTTNDILGYRIMRSLGIVRGITVRSRSMVGNLGAALQTMVGGNISIYTELCEKAREEAFELMLRHAAAMGANAVWHALRRQRGGPGVTEVLAYGTAVQVEPSPERSAARLLRAVAARLGRTGACRAAARHWRVDHVGSKGHRNQCVVGKRSRTPCSTA